jgi:hypothetical protein
MGDTVILLLPPRLLGFGRDGRPHHVLSAHDRLHAGQGSIAPADTSQGLYGRWDCPRPAARRPRCSRFPSPRSPRAGAGGPRRTCEARCSGDCRPLSPPSRTTARGGVCALATAVGAPPMDAATPGDFSEKRPPRTLMVSEQGNCWPDEHCRTQHIGCESFGFHSSWNQLEELTPGSTQYCWRLPCRC